MNPFVRGVGLIVALELRQRVRGVAWYVLLGVFVVLVGAVTGLLVLATARFDGTPSASGGWLFSLIAYFVLLLASLVTPALSGNAINGERDAGTLATTQVTLITTGQLVLGKFLASWISALAFLVVSIPFVAVAVALGGLPPVTFIVSTLVLALELGLIAAIGVGLSGIMTRPLFSIVVTYLVVAALSVGTLIAFGLLGSVTHVTKTQTTAMATSGWDDEGYSTLVCDRRETREVTMPRFDLYWGVLAANPYVVLADAAPPNFGDYDEPRDMFTTIAVGVRAVQHAPTIEPFVDHCENAYSKPLSQREIYEDSTPSWFVGLIVHAALAAGALVWAWRRTTTPARHLPRGSRVA